MSQTMEKIDTLLDVIDAELEEQTHHLARTRVALIGSGLEEKFEEQIAEIRARHDLRVAERQARKSMMGLR